MELDKCYYQIIKSGIYIDKAFDFTLSVYEDVEAFEEFLSDFIGLGQFKIPLQILSKKDIQKFVTASRFDKEYIYSISKIIKEYDIPILVEYCPPFILDKFLPIMKTFVSKELCYDDVVTFIIHLGFDEGILTQILDISTFSFEQFIELKSIVDPDVYQFIEYYLETQLIPTKVQRSTISLVELLKYCKYFPQLYELIDSIKIDPSVSTVYSISEICKFKEILCGYGGYFCKYDFSKSSDEKYWVIQRTFEVLDSQKSGFRRSVKKTITKTSYSVVTKDKISFQTPTKYQCKY